MQIWHSLNYCFLFHFRKPSPTSDSLWPVYSNETKLVKRFGAGPKAEVVKTPYESTVLFWESIIPAAYHENCHSLPVSEALTSTRDDNNTSHVTFLGTWVSVPAAEYIMNGLICILGFLLFSLLLSLAIILRQSYSTSFRRLKWDSFLCADYMYTYVTWIFIIFTRESLKLFILKSHKWIQT